MYSLIKYISYWLKCLSLLPTITAAVLGYSQVLFIVVNNYSSPPVSQKHYSRPISTSQQLTDFLLLLIYSGLPSFTSREFFILFTTLAKKKTTKKMLLDMNKLHFYWICWTFSLFSKNESVMPTHVIIYIILNK